MMWELTLSTSGSLDAFLDVYYSGTAALVVQEDFEELVVCYAEKARRNNVVYAEVFFDPQAHTGMTGC